MALQGEIILDNGIVLSSGYLLVIHVDMNYIVNDNNANIRVLIYKDSSAYSSGKPEVIELEHTVNSSDFDTYFSETVLKQVNKTNLTQAYVWLKTLSQYSSLTEV